jgi:WD40 repeat protein
MRCTHCLRNVRALVHAKRLRDRERDAKRERKRERDKGAEFRSFPNTTTTTAENNSLLRLQTIIIIIMSLPNVSEWFKPRIQTRPTLEKALESSSRLDEESVFNLQILTHLRSKLEFRESAEVFLREAREKMLLPRRMDANGFEREMSVWEMEAKFGMTRNDAKRRQRRYDINEEYIRNIHTKYSWKMYYAVTPPRADAAAGGMKNPLAVVARGGRRPGVRVDANEKIFLQFDDGETAFTRKCANTYFGERFECQRTLHAHRDACYCAVYNKKGDKLVTGADDWLVKIWNARNGGLLASCRGHTEPITIVEVCPRDYLVASGSLDKDVRTWKLESGEPVSVLKGHFMPITVVLFNPAKPWILASASEDGTMRLWHAYKHSGEQNAAVFDVHGMVSGPQAAADNDIDRNGNENENNENDTTTNNNNINNNNNNNNNPPDEQRQQQVHGRGRPRTRLTRVSTLSFNCDGTALIGGTDTCAFTSSRLFCYDFDLSKINDEAAGEAPPIHAMRAYDMPSNGTSPCATHTHDVDVTKFSNTDPRTFISGSSDGYVMCWRMPPKPADGDGMIALSTKNASVDKRVRCVWKTQSECWREKCMDGNGDIQRPFEVLQAVWTKDDKYVIATFANAMRTAEGDGASPSVEFFHSHSGESEGIIGHNSHEKTIVTLEPHPFYPEIYLTGGYDGRIEMRCIGGLTKSMRTFRPEFNGIKIVELHWNPDGLSFVASDVIGNCYLFGVGDNKRYLTQKKEQFFSVEFVPESDIARDEHGVARVYQDPPANLVYGENLFERYSFGSEVLCDQMGDPYSAPFVDAFKKGENLEKYFCAIPPNPSEREFEGVWNRRDGCKHSSMVQLMISNRYNLNEFVLGDDPVLENDDEVDDPDDVERDPDIIISDDDDDDDDENENDAAMDDLRGLEDSENANASDDDEDDDWGVTTRRRTRRRRADNRVRIEAAENRRRLRRAGRRSYVESETDTDEEEEYESDGDAEDEEEEARLRTRRRQNSQQLNSESEENEAEEEEDRRPGRLTFVMGPAKRSDQCFSWLLREFQGYGCYVPQLGDSVMYIPQGHEEFLDAMEDTLSCRVWEEKEDVRFCEPCVVSDLKYIINTSNGSRITDAPYETICEVTLRFADPRSANFGETFSLKLPRLSVPDFIVCVDRFTDAREQKWKANDQNVFCLWDWEIEDEEHPGNFGTWWHGEISSVVKNEGRWRGSPWNNLRITYSNQANETVTHCFWELFDADDKLRWRRAAEARQRNRASDCLLGPALSTEVTRALTQKVEKLIANDRFLAYVTDASCDDVYLRESLGVNANYCKIVPLPMSLERIKHRLKGRYYRQLDAFKSDAELIWTNAALFHGLNSSFEAVAKEIRDELLKDVDENDFVAETHEIHLNFPSYGVIKKEKKSEEEEETALENEDRARMISEETKAEEEKEEEQQPTSRRTTRANALTTPRDSLPSTTQRSSSRLRRGSNR